MLFNSVEFLIFLPLVFILYWYACKGDLKKQNVLLLVASYYFYSCWDWRFLFLLVFSTFLDYYTGLQMQQARTQGLKKFWFWLSIAVNLGFLGFFKYYNFFVESMADLLTGMGLQPHYWTLRIILPVGISFYTFHGLSYVIDIYKERIKPEKNFVDYAVFVSFFPLLVAGPIERATHLLPQIQSKRHFNYSKAVDGLRQILWGLFKKMVIADNCANYVDMVFNDPAAHHSGGTYLMGLFFFSWQVYGDFSGYSDIALGTARLFGIELLQNFSYPYFSRDTGEFWRRWHISLSSWFRDYLYIPLGGSSGGTWGKVRNNLIVFTISGFWHGAAWTFVLWGLLNGLYLVPGIISKKKGPREIVAFDRKLPTISELGHILATFMLITMSFAVFRPLDLAHVWLTITEIFSSSLWSKPVGMRNDLVWLIVVFIVMEWMGRRQKYAIETTGLQWPRAYRWAFYTLIILAIFWFKPMNEVQFFYFQF